MPSDIEDNHNLCHIDKIDLRPALNWYHKLTSAGSEQSTRFPPTATVGIKPWEAEMQPMNETDGEEVDSDMIDVSSAPRVGDWLWRPWFAKLWWLSIVMFWAIDGAAARLDIGDFPLKSEYFYFLAMVLHPQAALPVLGFGYIRKLFEMQNSAPSQGGADENLYAGNGSMGFHRPLDYLADPTDPRSPLNPLNPLSPTYRDR